MTELNLGDPRLFPVTTRTPVEIARDRLITSVMNARRSIKLAHRLCLNEIEQSPIEYLIEYPEDTDEPTEVL